MTQFAHRSFLASQWAGIVLSAIGGYARRFLAEWEQAGHRATSRPITGVLSLRSLQRTEAERCARVEADTAEEAVDLAYDGDPSVEWRQTGVLEFDARRVYALYEDGEPTDGDTRGKG